MADRKSSLPPEIGFSPVAAGFAEADEETACEWCDDDTPAEWLAPETGDSLCYDCASNWNYYKKWAEQRDFLSQNIIIRRLKIALNRFKI